MKTNKPLVHPMIVRHMTEDMPFCDAYAMQKMNIGEFHNQWISPIGVMAGLLMVAFACYKPIFPVVWMTCVFAPVLLWNSVKLMFQYNRLYALWDSLTDSVQGMEQVFKLGDTSHEPDGKVVGHIRGVIAETARTHLFLERELFFCDTLIEISRKHLGDLLDVAKACWGNRIDDGHGLEKFFRLAKEQKAK